MPNVTVLGAGGHTVTIPFSDPVEASIAQLFANGISSAIQATTMTPVIFPGGVGPVTGGSTVAGGTEVVATVAGANFITGSTTMVGALIDNAAGLTSLTLTGSSPTVIASSNMTITNDAGAPTIFLNGGYNSVFSGPSSGGAVYVDGGSGGVTYINSSGRPLSPGNPTLLATFVGLFTNADVEIHQGVGSALDEVVVPAGTNQQLTGIGAAGSSPIVVIMQYATTVGAATSSQLIYTPQGASTIIVPNSLTAHSGGPNTTVIGTGSIVVEPGFGNTTVYGGAASVAGQAAPVSPYGPFDGTVSVYGGTGLFEGGIGGANFLEGATSGATTLVGANNGDTLIAQAGNNKLFAGQGNETLISTANTGGDVFYTGSGSASTLVYGAASGGNTINFMDGSSTVFGQHGASATGSNLYIDAQAGGTDTIGDFIPGVDTFSLSLSQTVVGGAHPTVTSDVPSGGNTLVHLSDGTTINFLSATVANNNINFT